MKFRIYPRVAGKLPLVERVVGLLHGLSYLHGVGAVLGLLLLAWTLVTGAGNDVWSNLYGAGFPLLALVLVICDFFRYRFYLRPRREGGLHWRGALLRQAKWPAVLLAVIDASHPRRTSYAITAKTRQPARRALLLVPHGAVVVVMGAAMLVRPAVDVAHAVGALSIAVSLTLLATTLRSFPPPYTPP